jgi:dTDP-glucose 4,6-dehydratase
VNWAKKTVLVTGAGGFVGSHLAERLVELGAGVRALVHYNALNSRGWLDASPLSSEMHIVAGDICDRDSIRRIMDEADVVFHLAALVGIPYSYIAPESYVRTNVQGTLNVLQAARETRPDVLIHTSTSEVYGTALHVPIDEAHPLQGQSPYSASKIGADKMVEAFHRSFDLAAITIRPFNIFGPRQSARAVIPSIVGQILSGDIVKLGNLRPTRDLNYVANTVNGYVLAASTPAAVGQTINLGSGREIGIGDLAQLIGRIAGRCIKVECAAERLRPGNSEVERLIADHRRASAVLGWEPEISLEDGLRRTIEWVTANLDKYRPRTYAL